MPTDNSAHSIRFGRAGQFLRIDLIEAPSGPSLAAQLARGGHSHHVDGRIEAVVDGFRACYTTDLFGVDFPAFREELARLYSFEAQEAGVETADGELKIEIKGDGRGHFEANCVARINWQGAFPCFTFTLEFDQTDIPRMLAEFDAVLGRMP
jgi:hypothetical protein